ncbi:MAG: ATP-binding protein, partial [Candidatus Omnitrophica bacterium]|nr:ATP-binding protein [Candidatus Omnitrophota bacterium]
MVQFQKAVKYGALLRLALIGTSGSGKTYSALAIATGLGLPIAFIDTERGSARKYADLFDFDVLELESFSVDNFIAAINAAEKGGYRVLIIDSLSHAWSGKDGILEFVDMETAKSRAKNAYTSGWRSATPLHNKLVDTILGCKMHVIACMRSKSEYVLEEVNGKKVPRKIGLQPVQREGMEYEFDVLGDLDQDHNLVISKSRCAAIDNKLFPKPGAEFAAILNEWLGGAEAPAPVAKPSAPIATPDPAAPVTPLRSDDVEKAVAKLGKRLRSYYEQGINGFNDVAVMKADMKLMLGIDDLKLATDDHMENILLWHNGLGGLLSNRDMLP